MKFSAAVQRELGRALRNFKFDKAPSGVLFPKANLLFAGVFGCSVDGGPMFYGDNAVGNDFINDALNAKFNGVVGATTWYFAPFTNNIAPVSTLTAATFNSVQAEYTGYTEAARQVFTSNGTSTAQSVSNSAAAATITIGATAATPLGAGLLSVSAKGATTGAFGAGGLFGVSNTLSSGSKLTMTYTLSGTSL